MEKNIEIEYYKCLTSLEYGIGKYMGTHLKRIGGYGKIDMYPKFREGIKAIDEHRFNIIKKSRQVGGSTLITSAVAMKMALANESEPETIIIITNKKDMGYELLNSIRRNLNLLPREFWGSEYSGSEENLNKDIFKINRKLEIMTPNGSRVKVVGTSRDAIRGFRPTWVIIDEAAYVNSEWFGSILPALDVDGRCTLISTPNGFDELFYRTYADAINGHNDFHVTNIMWYHDPRFNKELTWLKDDEFIFEEGFTLESMDEKLSKGFKPTSPWYRNMCKMLNNEDAIKQDLDASFV